MSIDLKMSNIRMTQKIAQGECGRFNDAWVGDVQKIETQIRRNAVEDLGPASKTPTKG